MKILLITPASRRRTKLIRWLRRHDAVIVGLGPFRGIQILEEIARCTPHLVIFAEESVDFDTQAVITFIAEDFQSLSLICLPFVPGAREVPFVWGDFLLAKLKAPLPSCLPTQYAAETRLIFHDPFFEHFAKEGKLGRGAFSLDRQCAKLFLLLDGGQANHQRAKDYLHAVEASLPGLDAELAYRMVRASYKSLSWARELCSKCISILAHYVPDVEVEYLPLPRPIHTSVEYVHYHQPSEGHYALSVLTQLEINQGILGNNSGPMVLSHELDSEKTTTGIRSWRTSDAWWQRLTRSPRNCCVDFRRSFSC